MNMQTSTASGRATLFRRRLADYMDLTKPRIMMLTILTVLGGMSLAAHTGWPATGVIWAAVGGVALAVGAGGALNNFIERDLDARMARTANRPLPSGRIHPMEALIFGTTLWITSYFILYFFVNPPTAFLTMLAFGSYVGIYTPLKTRSSLCTLVGAVPGAMPPLIGWTAVRGHIEFSGVVLFAFLFFWQIPHFLALALLRRDDYAQAGMPMLPVESGERVTLHQMTLYTAAAVAVSLMPHGLLGAGSVYLCLAALGGAGFLALAFLGQIKGANPLWCGTFFFYSIIYAVVLFGALIFDS